MKRASPAQKAARSVGLHASAEAQNAGSVCDRYRAALQHGENPRIEDYLTPDLGAERTEVFRVLLSVELAWYRRIGLALDRDGYFERFPEFAPIIHEQCAGLESFHLSEDTTCPAQDEQATRSIAISADGLPILERYRLVQRIGRGGFGEVWRAVDDVTGRVVAVKGPRSDRSITAERVQEFLAEAERVRHLEIPGVVKVLDIVQTPATPTSAGRCFLVMELLSGGSLADRFPSRPPLTQSIDWMVSLAGTLVELHRRDMIHRDVKPENILFDGQDRPHLSDFGLAATEEEQLVEDPGVLGTVVYMAPEQARGTRVDRRADIYSLGVVLYRLLSGNKLPYLARNGHEYLQQIVDPHVAPRALPENVPEPLARICERCLQQDATQRYRSASELKRDLQSWQRRQRLRRGLVVTAVVLLLGLGGVFGAMWRPPDDMAVGAVGQSSVSGAPPKLRPGMFVEEIVWPEDEVSSWSVNETGSSLQVSSDYISLLGIGTLDPQADLRFEISFRQLQWTGFAGLFFGLRPEDGEMRFEVLEFRKVGEDYRWIRFIRNYAEAGSSVGDYNLAMSHPLVVEPRAMTLSIAIRNGRLTEVRCDGRPLRELTDLSARDAARVDDCRGNFGFFNLRSSATYANPKRDGKPVVLRKRSD